MTGRAFMVGESYRVALPTPNKAIGLRAGEIVTLKAIDMVTRPETLFWVRAEGGRSDIPLFEDELEEI